MWQKLKQRLRASLAWLRTREQYANTPNIIPRQRHNISRDKINPNALKVLYRLKGAGYAAYLVGGSVRDLLLEHKPKDFDVVTDAHPEDIRSLFRNCRLIGRRFRLAHVHFHGDIIEVATFRASVPSADQQHIHTDNGMLISDNVYGDIQQDAWRRDFTINALYYNIADFSVRDYVDGMHDLQCKQIRLIGDPNVRYQEDPVRILRAIRFSMKLGFTIHPDTEAPIHTHAHLMNQVAPGRMYEEFKKMFFTGKAAETFAKLRQYDLLAGLFPLTADSLRAAQFPSQFDFIQLALKNTDQRIRDNRPITVGFFMTALLWYPVLTLSAQYHEQGLPKITAYEKACRKALSAQAKVMSLPRFVSTSITEILLLQTRLNHIQHPRAFRVIEHGRFKAAYDFLLLRADAGENVKHLAAWWTEFFEAPPHERNHLVHARAKGQRSGNKRRKKPADLQEHADAPPIIISLDEK